MYNRCRSSRPFDLSIQISPVTRSVRSGQSLNVTGEKTSEEVFFHALRDAAKQWPSALKDYTASVSQYGPRDEGKHNLHYILFIELEGEPLTEAQTDLVRPPPATRQPTLSLIHMPWQVQ